MKLKTKSKKNKVVYERIPVLEKGVNLLRGPSEPAFQELIGSNLNRGEAVWIDVGNTCSTYTLSSRCSSNKMNRIKIGRAFTPFQHYSLVDELELNEDVEILALSNITALYSELSDRERQEIFLDMWDKILEILNQKNLKILVSLGNNLGVSYAVEASAQNIIETTENSSEYKETEFNKNFKQEKTGLQTRITYWSGSRKIRPEVKA